MKMRITRTFHEMRIGLSTTSMFAAMSATTNRHNAKRYSYRVRIMPTMSFTASIVSDAIACARSPPSISTEST